MTGQQEKPGGILRKFTAVFERGYFAVFMIASLLLWNGLMIGLAAMPEGDNGLATFASEFRRWCFGYAGGPEGMDWSYLIPFITAPLVLGGATFVIYHRQLREVWRRPLALSACLGVALGVVGLAGAGFYGMSERGTVAADAADPDAPLEFPAERLRTSYNPPEIDLTDQVGERFRLEKFHGKVVILTGIYSTCPHT